MRANPDFAQYALGRLKSALTARAVSWLTSVIDDPTFNDATTAAAFAQFLDSDEPAALRLLDTKLVGAGTAGGALLGRLHELVVIALRSSPATAWATTYPVISDNDALAGDVLRSLAHFGEFDAARLNEDQVVELWELADRLFPAADDPVVHGVHAVSVRESIGHFRDRLLPDLAERGTLAAVEALRRVAAEYPNVPSLRRIAARAEAALRRSDWTPLNPAEVLSALSSAKLVLRSDRDLLAVVLKALEDIQQGLRGATPMATFLWNHMPACKPKNGVGCMPKSEDDISDYLTSKIADIVPGASVNREVQVTRVKTSGIGQRTDILVEVPAAAENERILRVVIEVKGCWNDEIPTAIEDQLVAQYLTKWPGSAGIFLVAWFDPSHGAKAGSWLTDNIRNNPQELSKILKARADAATISSGHVVHSLVLDCSMPS